MSINHYSSLDLPETTLWWTQQQQHHHHHHHHQQQQHMVMEPIPNPSWPIHHHHNQPSSTWFNSHQDPSHKNPNRFNLNNEEEEDDEEQTNNNNNEQTTTSQEGEEGQEQDGGEEEEEEEEEQEEEKEPMFEKPLTPSDVGKLNRLVIPKQHAEKYFPLGAANNNNSNNNNNNNTCITSSAASASASDSTECKGLLLSFEDESGKCWRFRYSYWNSSQSYVLTKGWSRYVKDKRLDAGDVVSFHRHRADSHRLFIRWRRRSASAVVPTAQVSRSGGGGGDGNGNGKSGGVGWTSGFYCAHPSYPAHHHHHHHHQQLAYQQQHDAPLHAAGNKGSEDVEQRRRGLGKCSSSKVLRLFGVNMECQPQHESGPECSYNNDNNNIIMPSTQGADTNNHLYHHEAPPPNSYSSSNSHHPQMLRQQPYYY